VIETGSEGEFVGGTVEALLDDFGAIGASVFESLAQDLDVAWMDEEAEGALCEILLEPHAAIHIHIEDDVFARGELAFYLTFECAIEAVVIDFLILYECVLGNFLSELFGLQKEVLHSVVFVAARGARGGRYGEMEIEFGVRHEGGDEGALATATRGAKDEGFACFFHDAEV